MQRHLTCLALVVLLAVPTARAQTRTGTKLEPPDLDRYLRWGPVRVRPLIEMENVGYDDNIFADNRDPEGDYTATIAPAVEGLFLLGSRAFLEFEQKFEYVTFASNSDQSYLNLLGEGRLTVPHRRMGVFFDFELDRVEERPQDRLDSQRKRDTNGFGAGVILLPGHRTEIELSGTWSDWKFTDEDVDPEAPAAELDRTENGASLVGRYDLRGRAWLTLDVSTESIDFDDPSSTRDSREWTTRLGMEFGDEGPLRGRARLGWTNIQEDAPNRPDFTEVVGDMRLRYRLNPRAWVTWNARREAGFTASGDTNYYLVAEYEIRFLYYLTSYLGLEAGTEVGRLTFPDAPPLVVSSTGAVELSDAFSREDDINRYDVGVRLRLRENSLGRRLEYKLGASRYRRNSNRDGNDLSRSRIGLGIVIGF